MLTFMHVPRGADNLVTHLDHKPITLDVKPRVLHSRSSFMYVLKTILRKQFSDNFLEWQTSP